MMRDRVLPVALSVVIIVLIAVVQERSRYLGAIIATMPLTAPLAMWIVFAASRGDQRQTADFVGSMVIGFVGGLVFVLVCWVGLRREWGFVPTVAVAMVVWAGIVALPRWVGGWPT
jgi:uncharacterized membrane protein (GlpM family)